MVQAARSRLLPMAVSIVAVACPHSESERPFQRSSFWKPAFQRLLALVSVHEAPSETLPGTVDGSAAPPVRSWQVAHAMLSGCPLGARANGTGRWSASVIVDVPEKRVSMKNSWPSFTAAGSLAYLFVGS